MTITITLPDGSTREHRVAASPPARSRPSIGRGLAKAALAARNGRRRVVRPRPAARPRRHASRSSRPTSDDGREVLRHSTAHVLAQAVTDLFPGAKYAIGPAIADGFYYDFELPDGAALLRRRPRRASRRAMREIVKADEPFVREELDRDDALAAVRRPAVQASRSSSGSTPTTRRRSASGNVHLGVPQPARRAATSEFVDLCRGPHVPSTKRLGAFKLTKVAGAYWRGDEKRPMLQRIYGTAWESKAALDEHLHRLEEAEKRDHRKLGAELDLFSFPEEIGSGLAVFHPKGGAVRRVMEDYSRQRHEAGGLRVRQLAAHHEGGPVRDVGPPRLVRRRHVPADGARRRHRRTTSSR